MSRDIYNERWQPGESLLCSPKDPPGESLLCSLGSPLPLQGWGHTHCGEPSPCPGLLWDTDQFKPCPSPILASFPNNLPLPRLRTDCPPRILHTCRSWGHLTPEGLLLGRVTVVMSSCRLHPGPFSGKQRGKGREARGTDIH